MPSRFSSSLDNAIIKSVGTNLDKLKQLREIMSEAVDSAKIKEFVENVGICSFSQEFLNTLMWSHYADNHRGVCLTYGIPNTFFDETVNDILGIVPVDYGSDPLSDWFLHILDEYVPFEGFIRSLIKKAFAVKAELWQHEQEVRIVRKTAGVQAIDRRFLKQICFGLATPDADIALVKNIVDQRGYKVDLCSMRRNAASDFGLEPIAIEHSTTQERQMDNHES